MGLLRKYGTALICIIALFLIISMPDSILALIPSFSGSPLDLPFMVILSIMFIALIKG